ncbi:afamin isoform X1 [Physeter macrocephalus]|uniref:Afamin isoform X1 n=1 Tax=Physeter macrocephalus TaxID=9755 RepID=A0A2Y9FN28_PHYMC|nr:afamin isoform X1 [Physeter catodon]|eukprot:XP_007126315.1 afamin isoform X1 [Physeter catodon]
MKQLKLTGFLFFFFLTESLTLPTKPQDVDDVSITQKFIEDNIGYITIIAFAQYIQEASFEEVEMLVKAMTEYRDKCLADMTLPECSKLANDVLLENICTMEGLPQKHNFSHCCHKADFERKHCFLHNKKADVGFLPPLPTLDPEEKCQTYKNNRESLLNNYIYEVSRRNPYVFAPTLLTAAARFEEMTKTCCEEQEKANCFRTKAETFIQYLKALSSYQKNVCGALMKFGPQILKSINIAVLSQKFPKIEFKELISLLEDVSSKYDGCCEGDVVQCIHGRSKVVSHICSKQDSISSKIKECCEKKIPERGECIIYSNKDDRPNNLPLREAKFTESENVCEERDADQENFMAEFLYQYSRRHPELSTPELLRIAGVYEDLLRECCNTKNPPDCYRHAENKFNETTEKSFKIVQRECEHFQILGKDDLKYHYLINLTKLAPQLSTEELTFLGKEMVTALTTCCTLSEEFACVDNLVDLVLGELCGINENRSINPAVDHCCKTNFAFRRSCFEGLEADKTYVSPSTSQGLFTFHTDLCQAHNEELQRKKDRFLVDLVKLKPELTGVELQSLLVDFTNVVKKCCQAQGPEACFKEEVLPALFPLKSNWYFWSNKRN